MTIPDRLKAGLKVTKPRPTWVRLPLTCEWRRGLGHPAEVVTVSSCTGKQGQLHCGDNAAPLDGDTSQRKHL